MHACLHVWVHTCLAPLHECMQLDRGRGWPPGLPAEGRWCTRHIRVWTKPLIYNFWATRGMAKHTILQQLFEFRYLMVTVRLLWAWPPQVVHGYTIHIMQVQKFINLSLKPGPKEAESLRNMIQGWCSRCTGRAKRIFTIPDVSDHRTYGN